MAAYHADSDVAGSGTAAGCDPFRAVTLADPRRCGEEQAARVPEARAEATAAA